MRKKRAIINIAFSLLLEFITVISGFIVPRLFISTYGSEVNGLMNSIASFIGYITLLQTGVGSVVKAALYKPLASNDRASISSIVKTSERFFSKIGIATIIYITLLAIVFPVFITPQFDFAYTASLVVIIGLSTIAQYFFGITYQMLLEADQRAYVYSVFQITTIVLNTIFVVLLVNRGYTVQFVKLSTAVFYVARPVLMGLYVKKKYRIKKNATINNSLISQRWDSFSQGIATFVHSKTDVFVLTIFSSLTNVSIYSVYAMVTAGLSSFLNAIDKSIRSAFGNIIALNQREVLNRTFNAYNSLMHMLSTVCFSTAAITVFSFVNVYVGNNPDANYIQKEFGILIITAEFIFCLRSPYHSIIFAAGKFKETKMPAMIEAIINIVLSCLLVNKLGIVGVAIGTMVAMSYRTVSFVAFLRNNVLFIDVKDQIKRYVVTFISFVTSIIAFSQIRIVCTNYFSWAIYALVIFVCCGLTTLLINTVLLHGDTVQAIKMLLKGRKKQSH